MIYNNILETIGNTPMVRLGRIAQDVPPTLLAKIERMNPGASIKDRVARALIENMEAEGKLKPGSTVVEASSGNMGFGLAMACAQRGYRCIIVIPDKMSRERTQMIQAMGGEVVIVKTDLPPEHPEAFMNKARAIVAQTPGAVFMGQFESQANPEVHYKTTAAEIWEQCEGKVDAFVMGMGTGGTISGVGRFLKEKNPDIRIIGAEPVGSVIKPFFDNGEEIEGKVYQVEGIGEDFIPDTLHLQYVDEMHWVTDPQSFAMARRICREEGIFVGGSSGSILHVGLKVAKTMRADQRMVVMFCDGGERYLSKFHDENWLRERGWLEE